MSPHHPNCDPLTGTADCESCNGTGVYAGAFEAIRAAVNAPGRHGACPRCRGNGVVPCMGCDQGSDWEPGDPERGPDVDE